MKVLKNNRGFSLVELIIVIAIMVALIAVLGPQYIKYVQSSRDTVVSASAKEGCAIVKSEYAAGFMTGAGDITVTTDDNDHVIFKVGKGVTYKDNEGDGTATCQASKDLMEVCGVDSEKTVNSDKVYVITIRNTNGGTHIEEPEDAVIDYKEDT